LLQHWVQQAGDALKNWSDARHGRRTGSMGFPSFRSKRRPMQSVSFVELNHQLSWLHESRHAVRLMLPQSLVQLCRQDGTAWRHLIPVSLDQTGLPRPQRYVHPAVCLLDL
jgi:hypothetical protein